MSAVPSIAPPPVERRDRVPPLENGDHLKADEFRRRYKAMPEDVRAELIGGIVFMSSPVRLRRHGKPHVVLSNWLGHYIAKTPNLEVWGDNATVRLDNEAEPQPDLLLALPPSLGGRVVETEEDYLEGPPEMVCEVASSTASIDLGRKLRDYRRNEVAEYLVWSVDRRRVEWFDLIAGEYVDKTPDENGLLKSTRFPGLWLDPDKLVALDLPGLFADLDAGAVTAEHAAFVKKLAAGKGGA